MFSGQAYNPHQSAGLILGIIEGNMLKEMYMLAPGSVFLDAKIGVKLCNIKLVLRQQSIPYASIY